MSVEVIFRGPTRETSSLRQQMPATFDQDSFLDMLSFGAVMDPHHTILSGVGRDISYSTTPGSHANLEEGLLATVSSALEGGGTIGCMLSGGMDSSLVASALARATDKTIHTFTVRFGEADDEIADAQSVSDAFGTTHHVVEFSLPDVLERMRIWATYSPSERVVYMPILEEAARIGVNVVFSGEGGDEVFAGYSQRYIKMLRYKSNSYARGVAGLLSFAPGKYGRILGILGKTAKFESFYRAWQTRVPELSGGGRPLLGKGDRDWMESILYLERHGKLVDYLSHLQCYTTALNLRVEYPLLDGAVEAFSTPGNWRAMWNGSTLHGKYPMLEALKKLAPSDIVENAIRPKHGFSPPSMEKWWAAGLDGMHRETLEGPLLESLPRSLRKLGGKPSPRKGSLYAAALDAWCLAKFMEAS